jgi:parallel beta-helix repeat protein
LLFSKKETNLNSFTIQYSDVEMKFFFVFVTILFAPTAFANTYFFSSGDGDDTRTSIEAQNAATPWQSLDKLNSFFPNLLPGDSVLFKRGDTFYGRIIVKSSGTATSPITFSAYGDGNNPIISGLTTLKDWSSSDNRIWESSSAVLGERVNVLLLNGSPQELGRYPNANTPNKGYLTFEAHTNNTSITDNQLSAEPNWTGGELLVRKSHWRIGRHLITNHTGNTITYTTLAGTGNSSFNPIDNFGYFIENHKLTLDLFGEWYYDPLQQKVGVFLGDAVPQSAVVEVSSIDSLIYVSKQGYVSFDHLHLKGANRDGFVIESSQNITVTNTDVEFSGRSGFKVTYSKNITVENCNVSYAYNNGIDFEKEDNYNAIRNNKVENTAVFVGMGQAGDGNGIGIFANGNGNLVEYNNVFNTGYDGIFFQKDSAVVRNNFINNYCVNKDDGGGIYTYTGPTNTSYKGRKITSNIILNGIGAAAGTSDSTSLAHGIFFDENVTGLEATENSISNASGYGIFVQYSRGITISNNTVFNAGKQLFMNYGSNAPTPITGNNISNNIFFSKLPSQMSLWLETNQNNIDSFARFDSNYYCRPLDDDMSFFTSYVNANGKMISDAYNFERWKTKYKKDSSSQISPIKVPAYTVRTLISANKFANGSFNSDISGIGSFTGANNVVKSYSTGVLDGGSLQISFTPSSSSASSTIIFRSIGPISSTKNYILRYSLKGSNDNVSMSVYLRQTGSPFKNLTAEQYRKISSTRTENEVLFSFPPSQTDATVVFKVANQDIQYWLDNIQFYEADVSITNPDDYILFDYNAAATPKNIQLADTYTDVRNNHYNNTATIAPYSSIVLIKKAFQTITFPQIPSKTYADTAFTITATASSSLPVSFRIVSGPATISDNTIRLTGVGTVVVEASQPGDLNYSAAVPVTQSFTVAKANQTISFAPLASKNYNDPPFSVTASASSGLPATFRIVSGPATMSGNTISFTAVGTVVVEAAQQGDVNYNAATPVTQSFTVAKANQTIGFASLPSKTYGDAPFAVTAAASSGLPVSFRIVSGPATVSNNMISITGVGTVVVEASQSGDANNNAAAPVTQSFTAASASQAISFPVIADQTYGNSPFTVTAAASSGLQVTFRIVSGPATISANTVTITGVGSVVVESTQPGDANYNPATPVTQSFTVAKASQTISFAPLPSKTYGDAPFTVAAIASSGLQATFRIVSGPATISGNTVTITGAGTVVIEAAQPGDANNNAATPVAQSFTVAKANQTISFTPLPSKSYGDARFAVTATASSGLEVTFRIVSGPATISGNTVTVTGAGTVVVEAAQPGDANNNAATPVTQSFTVAKASQTISFAPLPSKTYGDAPFAVTATAFSGLPVTFRIVSGPATISGNTITITGTGTVVVEATQPGDANNNVATPVSQSFTVAKASQTISFAPLPSKTYGDAPFTVAATASSGLQVTFRIVSGPATISGNTVTITGAGTVVVEAAQPGDANNNAATPVTQSFTVAKASQTITFAPLPSRTYGDAPFAVTANASSGLPVSFRVVSGPATISGNTVTLTGAGTVVVEAAQPGDANNNAATPVSQSFTVAKASQTISFAPLPSKTYGDPPFTVTATASSGLPVTFRIVSGPATNSSNTVTITGAGTVVVEAAQPGDANYNAATPVTQSFTSKLSQTITFTAIPSKVYGDPPFALSATASSGLPVSFRVVSGPAAISGNTITITGAGTVVVEAAQPGDANNNAATPVTQSFTVAKASQTISFGPIAPQTYGNPPFAISATASSGLQIIFRIVSGPATISGNTITLTGVGTVVVEASQPGNTNYNAATPVSQSFTSKLGQTITFAAIPSKVYGNPPFALSATASSGLVVSFRIVSGPATVSNSTVTITGAGTVIVEASQAGNTTYNAATAVRQSFIVAKANQTISFPAITSKSYGTAPFTVTASASSGLPLTFRIVSGPATISGSTITLTGIGTVVVEASQAGNANYNAATPVSQSFAVVKGNQTISFAAIAAQTYGNPPFTISATASSGLQIIFRIVSGPATISGNTITLTGVGTVVVEASQPGNTNYNAATPVSQSFTSKLGQTITFAAIPSKVYGNPPFALSATASSGLVVSFRIVSGPATVSNSTVTITGAGTVIVEASQAGNTTYNAATAVRQSFIVAKANQTISFPAITSKSYGTAPFTVTASASSGLPLTFRIVSGPATISGSTITLTGIGTVVVEASQAGNANYNAATPVSQSFAVVKGNQTISFAAIAPQTYGNPPFTISATASSGLQVIFRIVSGPATISGSTITLTGIGTVVVEASQPGNTNYNAATPVSQSFTSKLSQTVTFAAIPSKVYGNPPFALSATASSGLVVTFRIVSGPATVSGSTVTITGAGTVIVEASQTGNTTYNAASAVRQSFTVAKANQTISFPAITSKSSGTPPFTVTATGSSGLQVSFRIVSGPATISRDTVTVTGPGTVVVEASQAGNTNYNAATPVSQSFAVTATTTALRSSNVTQPNFTTIYKRPALTAYPNPFNEFATITVSPAETGPAIVAVYDLSGMVVAKLFNGTLQAGVEKSFVFKPDGLLDGTYIIRITTTTTTITRKIVLAK